MQKLKKALKKLAGLGKSKPAQAAKKAPASKKKTQPVAAKKPAAKKAAPAPKKAAAAKPAKKAAPVKPTAKAAAPAKAKAPEKASAKAAAPAAAKKAAAPAPAKTDLKKKKAAEVAPEEVVEAAPAKTVKPRKSDEARSAEMTAAAASAPEEDEEIVLTDADGRRYCRVKDCDQLANVDSYCRYHYLLFWKNIQNRKKILSEGKLERYVEELTARYPDKFLELLRKDLRSEKDFTSAIQELEIDEGSDSEFEDEAQSYLDEVRGMGGGAEPSGREEEDF